MWFIPYHKNLKDFSRHLRNNSTHSEIMLWKRLRAGSLRGYTFNRQKPLDRYIVDFYCKPLHLVIEIDGGYHFEPAQMIKDKERQAILELMGLQFLRFTNEQVLNDIESVVREIEKFIVEFEGRGKSPFG